MRIHRIIEQTKAEGPGNRFAIWVQGCGHRCRGCFETAAWDRDGGTGINVDDLVSRFEKVADKVDGVTILGGEPFDQAGDIAKFLNRINKYGKTVITFTGYTYQYLLEHTDEDIENMLRYTDVLADGEYVRELTDFSRPMVGSRNQNIIFLSGRISSKEFFSYKNCVEVRTLLNGQIQINGMGDFNKIRKMIGG